MLKTVGSDDYVIIGAMVSFRTQDSFSTERGSPWLALSYWSVCVLCVRGTPRHWKTPIGPNSHDELRHHDEMELLSCSFHRSRYQPCQNFRWLIFIETGKWNEIQAFYHWNEQ
jgi:hypothetical protein